MPNVLFLCTGNSARSIVGEVLFNDLARGQHRAYSAGSKPVGQVNAGALQVLQAHGHAIDELRSKSWDEFSGDPAPEFETVITVCDNAAAETCPVWNGAPNVLHWGLPDPAMVVDDGERAAAFEAVYAALRDKITIFLGESRDD